MASEIELASRTVPPCGPACVAGAWRRLEQWFQHHLPEFLDHLNPGATLREIEDLEKAIGRPLPEEVQQSFQIHNGVHRDTFLFSIELLSLEQVLQAWNDWETMRTEDPEHAERAESSFQEVEVYYPEGAIQVGFSNPGWIPLSRDLQDNHLGIDLAPGAVGVPGQVINFGYDEAEKFVLAWTWGWFLTDLVQELERGNFRIDPEGGIWLLDPPEWHFHAAVPRWSQAKSGGRRPRINWAIDRRWLVWNDGTVLRLARSIAEERAFDRLPILGDALEDAGCTDPEILAHCRQPAEHGRGCWLLAALLGKE